MTSAAWLFLLLNAMQQLRLQLLKNCGRIERLLVLEMVLRPGSSTGENVFPSLLKLTGYIAVIVILSTGLWSRSEGIQKIAAYLFLTLEAISLVATYKVAKVYRAGTWKPDAEGGLEKAASVLRGIIIFAGLILCISQNTAGIIIWVGVIVCWIASGVITEHVAGIPLKMTYGGWAVNRKRRRRK